MEVEQFITDGPLSVSLLFLKKNTSLFFFNYFNSGLYYFDFDFLFLALL
jgi:hypothetical protein